MRAGLVLSGAAPQSGRGLNTHSATIMPLPSRGAKQLIKLKTFPSASFLLFLFLFITSLPAYCSSSLLKWKLLENEPSLLGMFAYPESLFIPPAINSDELIGYGLFINNRSAEAAELFAYALAQETTPQNRDWLTFWYGLSYFKAGKFSDLEHRFRGIKTPWGRFFLAAAALQRNDYATASALLNSVITDSSSQQILKLESRYLIGVSLSRAGQNDAADSVFTELLDEYEGSLLKGEILYRRAFIELEQDSLMRAQRDFADAVEFYRTSARKESHWWADDAMFFLAQISALMGNYTAAKQYIDEMDSLFPDNPYKEKGLYLVALGELLSSGDSIAFIPPKKLSRQYRWDLYLRAGWINYTKGAYPTAKDNFLESAKYAFDSDSRAESYFFIAECEYKMKHYQKAADFYGMVKHIGRKFLRESLWGLGWSYYRLGNYALARQNFQAVEAMGENDSLGVRATFFSARTYYTEGKYIDALEKMEQFTKKNCGSLCDDADYLVILSLLKLNRNGEATEQMMAFLERYHRSPLRDRVARVCARLLAEQKDYEKTIEFVDKLTLNNKALYDSLIYLGEMARLKTGELNTPVQAIEQFISKAPDTLIAVRIILNECSTLMDSGAYNYAAVILDMIHTSYLNDSTAALTISLTGECYLGLNDTIAARMTFQQILEEYPESRFAPMGYIKLAEYHWRNGKQGRAINYLSRIKKLYPDTPYERLAIAAIGKIYSSLGRYDEARQMWSDIHFVSEEDTIFPATRSEMMKSYVDEGKYRKAAEFYHQTIDSLSGQFHCEMEEQFAMSLYREGNIVAADSMWQTISSDSTRCRQLLADRLYLDWGNAIAQTENYDRACSLLSLFIARSTDDSLIRLAREKILEVKSHSRNKDNH